MQVGRPHSYSLTGLWFLAFGLVLLVISLLVLGTMVFEQIVYGQGPSVMIQPNGQMSYIYPGKSGMPTIIMPQTGGAPTYIWPGHPAPLTPFVPVPVPAPIPFSPVPGWPQ